MRIRESWLLAIAFNLLPVAALNQLLAIAFDRVLSAANSL